MEITVQTYICLEGTVWRELRGIKSGINRQVFLKANNASFWILILYGRRFKIYELALAHTEKTD